MTLYFDTKIQFPDEESVSTVSDWHPLDPIFAIASYSQDKGGSVTIFSDSGLPINDVNFPINPVNQATALRWHPERKLLVVGWENGDLFVYYDGRRDFILVKGPHKRSPIILLEFSEKGGRLVTADAMGILTGWRCDSQGQLLTMFTHDLKDPLLHITFRKTVESAINTELTNLAKAAVAGDEEALDTLTNWRPRTAARNLTHSGVKDNHCFYVGTQTGILYYINQGGTCTEVYRCDNSPIIQIIWHPKRETIITLMDDMTVGHFLVEANGSITELDRVKFSSTGRTPGHNGSILWVGNTLAIITGDFSVRIWNIDNSESFSLNITLSNENNDKNTRGPINVSEIFSCISFCKSSQTLCAGTNQGRLLTWKKLNNYSFDAPEDNFQLTAITSLRGVIKHCFWGVCDISKPCIFVNCISSCYIMREQPLLSRHSPNIWVLQKTANQINVEHKNGAKTVLTTTIPAIELCLSDQNLAVTNGRSIQLYNINLVNDSNDKNEDTSISIVQFAAFNSELCLQMFLYENSLVLLTTDKAQVLSLSGVVLQDLLFTDIEGKPIGIDLTGYFLTIFSMNGYLKVYNISHHEPKLVTSPRSAYEMFENFGEIILAKCNTIGSHVLIIIANENLVPLGYVYIWHIETDKVLQYNFTEEHKLPVAFYWDTVDSRLFACETMRVHSNKSQTSTKNDGKQQTICNSLVHVMFVLDSKEIGIFENFDMAPGEKFIGFATPYIIILKVSKIEHVPLRDFKELEDCDDTTKKNVLNFSLYIALGKMDEAFSCIRSIQSNTVWINLAKMCVNTGRLDVAKVCLGHLKRARSVRALRRAMEDDALESEAKTAILAIELGMIDSAKELYKKCERYDLLNKLCQACGHFEEALQIAEKHDRIHLKNTYYKYAEWLKETGNATGALKYYEKSSNSMHNVTQMLMGDPQVLKKYMQGTTDENMLKWWAQYIESTGDMDAALKIYQKANDWLSQIRILCFLGQISKADAIARKCEDNAACYHMARHYESIERFQEAIYFYSRAQTYSNAVRICKENDLRDELWLVAISARPNDKASAAAYFEECSDYAKAVELYHKSGMLHKAIEMAFSTQQPEILHVITAELTKESDPELIERCADFFLQVDQNQKATMLLANSRQLKKALEVCSKKGVPITESMAEILTPSKEEYTNDEERQDILLALAEILQEQGDYQLATKKFTQAGAKVKAMKCLVKSSDTEKIIFFANMSRQKEAYIMAANYLQGLDWQSDPKILKTIVKFYTKAQSFDLLANFYANCAHIEIVDFRDYEKAVKALQEATKCLSKVPGTARKIENLHVVINEMKKVQELHVMGENHEHQQLINECKMFLAHREMPPIKNEHVQALLIEALIYVKNYPDAMNYFKDLIANTVDDEFKNWLDQSLVERLAIEMGVDFDTLWNVKYGELDKNKEIDMDDIEEQIN